MSRISRTFILAIGLLIVALSGSRQPVPPPVQAAPLGRIAEPIVVPGDALVAFRGAAAPELSAWSWGGSQWRQMHCQLDEREAVGAYVAAEDGALDDNDELVLSSDELGLPRTGGGDPPGLPVGSPYYEIVVHDPLAPDAVGHAYLYWSRGQEWTALPPMVSMDAESAEIRSAAYTVGFARPERDGFVGIARLSLHGRSEDLLDRMKIRVSLSGVPLPLNETMLAGLGLDLVPEPVISGPVRLIFDRRGQSWASSNHLRVLGELTEIPDIGPAPVGELRISFDLSSDALPATYRDENVPGGVPVDGRPDDVPSAPLPAWREVRTPAGRFVMLRLSEGRSAATVYYKDDTSWNLTDTGDMRSYGDQGVQADSAIAFVSAGFPGLIVVPPSGNEMAAAELLAQARAPLRVEVRPGPNLPTPGPTRPQPTRPPTATRPALATPTATSSASATPGEVVRRFVPLLLRNS